ncbi:HNH endonuclease signature motif containing protein [Propionicimonas sp.]|uniref:HNH endonuclease signature motif containing protein n=1 Tax=Propionicimonas sp. TaxID=1955623 RepID=UPI00182E7D2B|nr:HNH endonuclease signature motif containing protein [Propionicimonas sp.]MBU3976955.1 HNH endonuclease [Actinomycetota bacterium]MBA3020526.1 DUF222 domain-containing protein [Propionicimonas sp.]MBU3986700.1 HNH endonuclease [Actinomycetota bacterium]MBU4007148.1 HNH endonuclease [Actinomycetota bacterium]MBU4064901.1 HNH endonuclease [Actinomycetota bacterium]
MTATPTSLLNQIEAALDQFDASAVADRLGCAQRARALASRLGAISATLLAQADAAADSLRETGTPTTTWLSTKAGLSKREAAGLLHQARELQQRPEIGQAAVAGSISVNQARTISRVLDGLTGLSEQQNAQAEQVMLALAARQDCDQLAKAAPQVLAEVAPERGEEGMERRLQRRAEAAQRNRSLVFGRDDNGSVTFSGSLPQVAGEAFISLVDAYVESRRRSVNEERDPATALRSPAQRRADGLLDLITAHQRERRAPSVGGDRPRVVVTLSYDRLRSAAAGAGLISDAEPISAGDLRRLCCDADLVPAVLGTESEILDMGREQRLVTRPLRTALTLRDGGCVFPGCQTRPAACEAHHLRPWWDGGETKLSNLALLCHHHHGLVEPAKYAARDQWELCIGADGLPEAIPPRRYDPERRPLRHARLTARQPQAPPEQASAGGRPAKWQEPPGEDVGWPAA